MVLAAIIVAAIIAAITLKVFIGQSDSKSRVVVDASCNGKYYLVINGRMIKNQVEMKLVGVKKVSIVGPEHSEERAVEIKEEETLVELRCSAGTPKLDIRKIGLPRIEK